MKGSDRESNEALKVASIIAMYALSVAGLAILAYKMHFELDRVQFMHDHFHAVLDGVQRYR